MLKHKPSYFGHNMRVENESLEKSTMLCMVEETRGTGRSCMCWKDGVKATIKLFLPELQEAVQDRDVCINLVMNVSRSWPRLDETR